MVFTLYLKYQNLDSLLGKYAFATEKKYTLKLPFLAATNVSDFSDFEKHVTEHSPCVETIANIKIS